MMNTHPYNKIETTSLVLFVERSTKQSYQQFINTTIFSKRGRVKICFESILCNFFLSKKKIFSISTSFEEKYCRVNFVLINLLSKKFIREKDE